LSETDSPENNQTTALIDNRIDFIIQNENAFP